MSVVGIEPTTLCLKGRCSTPELHARPSKKDTQYMLPNQAERPWQSKHFRSRRPGSFQLQMHFIIQSFEHGLPLLQYSRIPHKLKIIGQTQELRYNAIAPQDHPGESVTIWTIPPGGDRLFCPLQPHPKRQSSPKRGRNIPQAFSWPSLMDNPH